jgi:hypothetical protein
MQKTQFFAKNAENRTFWRHLIFDQVGVGGMGVA